jgi:hypothetical protein
MMLLVISLLIQPWNQVSCKRARALIEIPNHVQEILSLIVPKKRAVTRKHYLGPHFIIGNRSDLEINSVLLFQSLIYSSHSNVSLEVRKI